MRRARRRPPHSLRYVRTVEQVDGRPRALGASRCSSGSGPFSTRCAERELRVLRDAHLPSGAPSLRDPTRRSSGRSRDRPSPLRHRPSPAALLEHVAPSPRAPSASRVEAVGPTHLVGHPLVVNATATDRAHTSKLPSTTLLMVCITVVGIVEPPERRPRASRRDRDLLEHQRRRHRRHRNLPGAMEFASPITSWKRVGHARLRGKSSI